MPPAYTPSQRSAIAQFVSFTSVKESAAAKVSYDPVLSCCPLIWGQLPPVYSAQYLIWQEQLADASHHSNLRPKDGMWSKLSMRTYTSLSLHLFPCSIYTISFHYCRSSFSKATRALGPAEEISEPGFLVAVELNSGVSLSSRSIYLVYGRPLRPRRSGKVRRDCVMPQLNWKRNYTRCRGR